jgi:REP element-mobilizing transposase RayT
MYDHQELYCSGIFHVYNRAVGKKQLFENDSDYVYFLNKLKRFILPIAQFHAYCLLPNHFHLLVALNSEKEIEQNLPTTNQQIRNNQSKFLSQQFNRCFNSYSKSFNKAHHVSGKLLDSPFKRVEVNQDDYYSQLIYYIHRNPIHHGLAKRWDKWKYSSYLAMISHKPTLLSREEVLEWFGGKEAFIKHHYTQIEDWKIENLVLE